MYTNRKLLLQSANQVSIEVAELQPQLKDEQVLVKVSNSGICGSDLHYFKDQGLGTFLSPMPMHIGHEVAGRIVESSSKNFKVGQLVAVEPGHSCANCIYCQNDRVNICPDVQFLGANAPGGQSDYVLAQAEQIVALPENIEDATAALFEPFTVGLHNAKLITRTTLLSKLTKISVIGGGAIGYFTALCVNKLHPDIEVLVFEKSKNRRHELTRALPNSVKVCELTDMAQHKSSCDVVFDAVGSQNTITMMQSLTGNGGIMLLIGISEVDNLIVNPHMARVKENALIFSRRSASDLELAREMFLDLLPMLTQLKIDIYPVERAHEAFVNALDWSNGSLRTQIKWS